MGGTALSNRTHFEIMTMIREGEAGMLRHLAKTVLVLALALISATGCSADSTSDEGVTPTASPEPSMTTSTTTVAAGAAQYVHPGSEELSARQVEMLDVLESYGAAFKARDGDQIATFMTDDAIVEYNEQGDVYFVADGSWQERVSNGPYDSTRTFEPKMVYGNRIIHSGTVDAVGVTWVAVLRFTTHGEVKIDKETIFHGGG